MIRSEIYNFRRLLLGVATVSTVRGGERVARRISLIPKPLTHSLPGMVLT